MRTIYAMMLASMLSGCMSKAPVVQSTKPWENHYMDTASFYEGTKDIKLNEGESIWVLSNKTLARLLNNAGAKTSSNDTK